MSQRQPIKHVVDNLYPCYLQIQCNYQSTYR